MFKTFVSIGKTIQREANFKALIESKYLKMNFFLLSLGILFSHVLLLNCYRETSPQTTVFPKITYADR